MRKIMKNMFSCAILMMMSFFLVNGKVYAQDNILTINASGTTTNATVSGTTDEDVAAVLIEIQNTDNSIVTLETHPVTSGSYSATLDCPLTEGTTYKVHVANYNSEGEPQNTTFTVPVSVTGVTLTPATQELTAVGATVQLTATVAPENATNKNVTFTSSLPEVATVDAATGLVTAVANGETTITVTTEDGSKQATAKITVNIPPVSVAVTGVTLTPETAELKNVGETLQLTAAVSPENATNKSVTFSSNNTQVAIVSASGLVTAVSEGTATITVTTADGNKTATSVITVTLPKKAVVSAASNSPEDTAAANVAKSLIDRVIAAKGADVTGVDKQTAANIVEAVEAGKTIVIDLQIVPVNQDAISADAQKIKDFIGSNANIVVYYDIDVVVKADDKVLGQITILPSAINVNLPIPNSVPTIPSGYTRKYVVVSVHDGVAKELPTTVNGNNASFTSNEFSTYALTYKDTANATTNNQQKAGNTSTTTTETKNLGASPKTFDSIPMWSVLLAAIFGPLLLIAISILIRRKDFSDYED
jgi:uncharacterized protein YjdB